MALVPVGSIEYDVEGERFTVKKGDIFFLPPSIEHDIIPTDEPYKLLSIW